MIEYCIDKDGVISGASKETLVTLKDRVLAKIQKDIELMCSITFALGKAETPAVNVAVPWHMTPWGGGDDMRPKFRPHFVTPEYPPMDSPAEYRRKMNKPWADPRAGMAFFNRDYNDMLKGLQELLSEPEPASIPFPADAEELKLVEFDDIERELEYWVGASYEEHLDDSGQRNFCKDSNLGGGDICTKVMEAYTMQPRGLNNLLSGDPGVTFGAI